MRKKENKRGGEKRPADVDRRKGLIGRRKRGVKKARQRPGLASKTEKTWRSGHVPHGKNSKSKCGTGGGNDTVSQTIRKVLGRPGVLPRVTKLQQVKGPGKNDINREVGIGEKWPGPEVLLRNQGPEPHPKS